jgi:hypothetical protein
MQVRRHASQPIRFAGSELGEERHICAFFDNVEEEYRVLLPFIQEGFERGDKAFHVVAPRLHEDHVQRLERVGIDVSSARIQGQLKPCDWEEAYLPDGRFDMHRMLEMWRNELKHTPDEGFPMTRLVAHMEWCREKRDGVSDLLRYEALFNDVPHRQHVVICTYDLRKHSGDIIIDVMRTHPMIIMGGMLHKNPFFVPPDEFLRELESRSAPHLSVE